MWQAHLVTKREFRNFDIRIYKQELKPKQITYFYTFEFNGRMIRDFNFKNVNDALANAMNDIEYIYEQRECVC